MKRAVQCPLCRGSEISHFLSAPDRFHLRTKTYELARCSICACVWMPDPPCHAELPFHYDDDYNRVTSSAGQTLAPKRWKQQRALISRYKHGGKLLDIGCSSGGFLGTLDPRQWELYGIEIAAQMASEARATAGAEVFTGSVMDASFAQNSFDVITCFDVLEHQYDPPGFLAKVRGWLKWDGIFIAVLPNIDSWESRMFGTFWYGLELPRHPFHFSRRSLAYLMRTAGFEVMSLTTPPISFIERSVSYCYEEMLRGLGLEPRPQSRPKSANLLWKVVRKAFRVSLIHPYSQAAALAGQGGSIQAVFRKSPFAIQVAKEYSRRDRTASESRFKSLCTCLSSTQ